MLIHNKKFINKNWRYDFKKDKENFLFQIKNIYLDNYIINNDYIILNIDFNQGSFKIDFSVEH
jgi:hypothetical protein